MRTLAGILLLISGVIFPMGMLFWLNGWLGRHPQPPPHRVGLLLAFNGVLPIALIVGGLALLSPAIGASLGVRAVIGAAALAALILAAALARGGKHGG